MCSDDEVDEDGLPAAVEALNGWLQDNEEGQFLIRVDSFVGGQRSKAMQCVVVIGAINYLDIDAFLKAADSCVWQRRDQVQIALKDEDEDVFAMYRLGEQRSNVGEHDVAH
jgi:hypothetical protein